MKLAAEPGEGAQAQALDAVTAYTQTFNKMGFIETGERDEIYMALRGILDALPGDALQKDSLIAKFDELHDFDAALSLWRCLFHRNEFSIGIKYGH